MNHTTLRLLPLLALVLAGCASSGSNAPPVQFDFGPAAATLAAPLARPAALVVTDATGAPALDNELIVYRLDYADPLQARSYANSRWSSTPLAMITQRLRTRVAQAGVKVLNASDAVSGAPVLRVEVDEFAHRFDSAAASHGQVVVRASLFQGHRLLDQKTFSRRSDAATADAAGGARALAGAVDAVAADMIAWIATVQVNPQ